MIYDLNNINETLKNFNDSSKNFIDNVLKLININYKEDIKIEVEEILELPIRIEKYLEAHFGLMMEINKKDQERAFIQAQKIRYYKEGYKTILSSQEAKMFMETDEEYIKVKAELNFLETLFKHISEIITELRSLQYILKTKLDYQKLINGAY